MNIVATRFRVGKEWRVGAFYQPAAREPTPGILLLHGYPGLLMNEDIAAELCRRGMTVFAPHCRGGGGSGGKFDLDGIFDDAAAALHLLARCHSVDHARMAVVGYGLGGWLALKLAALKYFAAAAVLAPAVPGDIHASRQLLERSGRILSIDDPVTSWYRYQRAAEAEHPERYVPRIAPTPLLFVRGKDDVVVSESSIQRLWSLAGEPKDLLEFEGEGHELQENRAPIVAAVCEWLQSRLAPVTLPPSAA